MMAAVKKIAIKLFKFVFRKKHVFQKIIKVFAVCTQFGKGFLNTYFYVFLEYRLFFCNKLDLTITLHNGLKNKNKFVITMQTKIENEIFMSVSKKTV